MPRVEYKDRTVYEAAKARISRTFDSFDNIVVSISGGKDSTVLFHLCLAEARRRDREIGVFFLDQEAEYDATIDQAKHLLTMDGITPYWYQVPFDQTNATSFDEYHFRAWAEGKDDEWMRPKDELAIHSIDDDYPERFYGFMEWFEQQQPPSTAMMVGLRSKESMNRFRSITENAGYDGLSWTTKTKGDGVYRVYPIYDFTFGDIWKAISDNEWRYNEVYDWMYADRGVNKRSMRVSNLIHEKSYRALKHIRKYEPDTFSRLVNRLGGIHFASIYTNRDGALDVDDLPEAFDSWIEYRDFLLDTTPTDKIDRYRSRFADQPDRAQVHRAQCKQLLINDWENNVPVTGKGIGGDLESVWRDRLEIPEDGIEEAEEPLVDG